MSSGSLNADEHPHTTFRFNHPLVCKCNPWIVVPVLFVTAAVISVAMVFAFMPNDPSSQDLPFDGGNQYLAAMFDSSGTRYYSSAQVSLSPSGSAYMYHSSPPRLSTLFTVNSTLDNSFSLSPDMNYNWTIVFLLEDADFYYSWFANDSIIVSLLTVDQVNAWTDKPVTAPALERSQNRTGTAVYKAKKSTFYYLSAFIGTPTAEPSGAFFYTFSYNPYDFSRASSSCVDASVCNFTFHFGTPAYIVASMDAPNEAYTLSLQCNHRWQFVVFLFAAILALVLMLLGGFIAFLWIRRKSEYQEIE